MIVNPDVDGHTITQKYRKTIRKTHKINNVLTIKRILKPKFKFCGRPVFTFSLPAEQFAPLAMIYCIYMQ